MDKRHVVFGTGAVALALVEELLARGRQVRLVDLNGEKPELANYKGAAVQHAGKVEAIAARPEDSILATTLCLGAEALYFCPSEFEWGKSAAYWLAWQKALLDIAISTKARLVLLENAKALGLTGETKITAKTLPNPQTPLGEALAEHSRQWQAAVADGRAQIVAGRAGELFGPGSKRDPLGQSVFEPAVKGKKIAVPEALDHPHSLGYSHDLARALMVLGERTHMPEPLWMLPSAPAPTLRQIFSEIAAHLGQDVHIATISKTKRRMAGFLSPSLRVTSDMLGRFEEPWVIDSRPIERAYGLQGTPLATAVAETLKGFEGKTASAPQGAAAKGSLAARRLHNPQT